MSQDMRPDPYQPIGSNVSSLWAILLYMVGGDLLYERKVSGIIIDYRRSEERVQGKSVDLGGRRIIKKKKFFQAEDGIRDIPKGDWSSDVCSSDLVGGKSCCNTWYADGNKALIILSDAV